MTNGFKRCRLLSLFTTSFLTNNFSHGFFSAEKPQLRVAICTIAEDLYNNFEDANLLRMAKDKGYFGFRTEEDEVPAPHSCAVNCWKWMWLPRPS